MQPSLKLKPTHKAIREFYDGLETMKQTKSSHEGAVAPMFANLLRHCASQFPGWKLVEQYSIKRDSRAPLRLDGAILDGFELRLGIWEAKDSKDKLEKEIQKKFATGYPKDNILFQTPERIVLWQNGKEVFDANIENSPESLIDGLQLFFNYQPPAYDQWQEAITGFKERVYELGTALLKIIQDEKGKNKTFKLSFETFLKLCQNSINPNLSESAVEEMLIQHLLTERIFRKVFNNPDFVNKNIIAHEIEQVITALTSRSFSRHEFLKKLDYFYTAIEKTATSIDDYAEKQTFLNAVYEQFFQGFAIKAADTHGIVYTPQPLVNFMVRSVDELLKREFNSSLSAKNVQILDPFVGTGNFIVRILREISPETIEHKYKSELHCNEIMLLPYYIASMNIEHAYFELTGHYQPFEGICLVDTFELAENVQQSFGFHIQENIERVNRQKKAPIFVIIGNPPYNAGQVNENDNNKNRKYETVDKWVADHYSANSKATNKNALSDPYVKAFAWATERLKDQSQGIIAFVTNNGFLEGIAFDGMRKQLSEDFTKIYHINLKGNARTSGERRRQECGNIFDNMIRVGVGITFLIKQPKENKQLAAIFIYSVNDYMKSSDKKKLLDSMGNIFELPITKINVNHQQVWLTNNLHSDFEDFISLGNKEQKSSNKQVEDVIFKIYSNGVKTNRDAWAYNFNIDNLTKNIQKTIEIYNEHVLKWNALTEKSNIDDFVSYDDKKISWGGSLKDFLLRGKSSEFMESDIRDSLYRPFTRSNLYFDRMLNERVYVFPSIFPNKFSEKENQVICVSGVGSNKPFHSLIVNIIPCLDFLEKTQCFPYYVYSEDGQNRYENITGWALIHFCRHYKKSTISKWDIFYYVYGVLHNEEYRQKYAANLRLELPRVPYAPDLSTFQSYSQAGKQLAELHLNYEEHVEYPLTRIYAPDQPHNWEVQKMKLNKDKTAIIYNDWLTLSDIPKETFEYRLGNRSALEWVIEQYQVKTDTRSGIVNDPNRYDDPQYIVRLLGQVIQVSVETVKIVKALPLLFI